MAGEPVTVSPPCRGQEETQPPLQSCSLLGLLLPHTPFPLELLFPCPSWVTQVPVPQPPQPLCSPIPVLPGSVPRAVPSRCPWGAAASWALGMECPRSCCAHLGLLPSSVSLVLGWHLSSLGQEPAVPVSPGEFRLSLGQGFAFPVPTRCWDRCRASLLPQRSVTLQGHVRARSAFTGCFWCISVASAPRLTSPQAVPPTRVTRRCPALCAAAPTGVFLVLGSELGTGGDTTYHRVLRDTMCCRHSVPGAASGILSVPSRVYPVSCPRGAAAGGG